MDSESSIGNFALWLDNPSPVDLLAFAPVAETVVAALVDDQLDPIALGVSGRWGSGKTTLLRLIETELTKLNREESKILVVSTDPWRYDPATGVKESLISQVLSALESELVAEDGKESNGKKMLKRLVQRVDWAKAIALAAQSSILLQIPSIDSLVGLVKGSEDDSEDAVRGLEAFREEFQELLASPDLAHVKRVVVLVDDLDRCLPSTVIETLEGIRLFLAVPKMSFVIAADEERVADAIRTRYESVDAAVQQSTSDRQEEPAKLYLHKIVQTTVPVPTLSRFDTEAYLLLLQILPRDEQPLMKELVEQCDTLRKESKGLSELSLSDTSDLTAERAFAERLTPILYEKLRGNPRRIKRFLNDLHVRQSIATRRGIDLKAEIIAKMMVLEQLLPDEFERLLGWLASGTLRSEMNRLEEAAGRPQLNVEESPDTHDLNGMRVSEGYEADLAASTEQVFDDSLLRWAKLTPSLCDEDLSAYLHLAASFVGETVLDKDLPERLRDLAARLLSGVRAEQHSVTNDDLSRLPLSDAKALLLHLARMGRDRPVDQRKAVEAILRMSRLHHSLCSECCDALSSIPGDEVNPPTVLLFGPEDRKLHTVLNKWRSQTTKQTTVNAIDMALEKGKTQENGD